MLGRCRADEPPDENPLRRRPPMRSGRNRPVPVHRGPEGAERRSLQCLRTPAAGGYPRPPAGDRHGPPGPGAPRCYLHNGVRARGLAASGSRPSRATPGHQDGKSQDNAQTDMPEHFLHLSDKNRVSTVAGTRPVCASAAGSERCDQSRPASSRVMASPYAQ